MLWIWKAFSFLTRTRAQSYNGPLYTSAEEMWSYCKMMGIQDPESRDELIEIIPELDEVYLDDYYKKQDIQRRKQETKSHRR